jgi:hypothetical protein
LTAAAGMIQRREETRQMRGKRRNDTEKRRDELGGVASYRLFVDVQEEICLLLWRYGVHDDGVPLRPPLVLDLNNINKNKIKNKNQDKNFIE